jgi:PAS domain S-box-containing protein
MQTPVSAQAEEPVTAPKRPKPRHSIRTLLIRLVFACLLPPVVGAGLWIYSDHQKQRTKLEQEVIQAAQAKVQTVDAELGKGEFFAQALATNETLQRLDFAAFHERSVQLLQQSAVDLRVVLYALDGQQLANTKIPYGQPLPRRRDSNQIKNVIATGRMAKPELIHRMLDGQPAVSIMGPVYRDKKVAYILAVNFPVDRLSIILKQLNLAAGSAAYVIDSSGTIVANTLDADKKIGEKTAPEILQSMLIDKSLGGFVKTTSLQSAQMLAAYSRSPDTGWGVVIDMPRQSMTAPLQRSLIVLGLSATMVLLMSLGLAWLMGNRIGQSMRALKAATIDLGFNKMMSLPDTSLVETDDLSRALQTSARLLRTRTQELTIANESLEARSNELTEAQRIAKIGNWKWTVSTGACVASDELLRVYGRKILLSFNEQKGMVFPDEAWQELKSAAKSTLKTNTGFSLLLPTFSTDGVPIWTRVRGEVTRNETGQVTGLSGTLQDVDLTHKAALALRDSESRLSLALSSSDLALWDWNLKTDAVYLDPRWASFLGCTIEELPSNSEDFLQHVHPEDFPRLKAKIQEHFKGQLPNIDVTYRVTHKLGHYVWISSIGKVVQHGASGNSLRILGVAHDVTERRRLDTEIAHLRTEMQDIIVWQVAQHTVAALAHEVNQPLASASILCEAATRMLSADVPSADAKALKTQRLEQTLQHITSDIERAGDVLRNLLKSVNKPDITRRPEKVGVLIIESLQIALDENVFGYPITVDYAAEFPTVKVNRLQVVKVLLNLIHNAAQAMHEAQMTEGEIWITATLGADGREICIGVQDNGPGISADLQEEIFQPLITTKSHGLGMGLTISRALIEANGGKLWHSQNDGPGATFHFTLPISS